MTQVHLPCSPAARSCPSRKSADSSMETEDLVSKLDCKDLYRDPGSGSASIFGSGTRDYLSPTAADDGGFMADFC